MFSWYSEQVLDQHQERTKDAARDYIVSEILRARRKPSLRSRAAFSVGAVMVRWGQRLQISNMPMAYRGTYLRTYR